MRRLSLKSTDFGVDPKLSIEGPCPMRRLSLKSTDFGVDPNLLIIYVERKQQNRYEKNISFFVSSKFYINL